MEKIDIDNGLVTDGLGRMAFSRHLFELLCKVDARKGAVVGLEGVWGSGKTSVLENFETFVNEVSATERPTLIRFNPWMVSGTTHLVGAMLKQLAPGIGSSNAQPTQMTMKILRYAQALELTKYAAPAAIVVNPEMGALFAAVTVGFTLAAGFAKSARELFKQGESDAKKRTLSEIKEEIQTDLRDTGRRIIVVVDDLDRLPPDEVAQIIQAVKATADFPNVVYLLAYDPQVTAHALKKAISIEDGYSYLEKIIQIPIELPEVPRSRMNLHSRRRLAEVTNLTTIGETEKEDLALAMPLVFAILSTPRDVERLRTRLQVAFPVLTTKVNAADVVILELLSLKCPEIIDWIGSNVGWLTDLGISQFDPDLASRGFNLPSILEEADKAKRDENKALREKSWKTILRSSEKAFAVEQLLKFLFPSFGKQYEKQTRSGIHRVRKFRFWYEWRCYHDYHNSLSIHEIESLVENPEKLIDAGITRDAEKFKDLTQQICDVGEGGFKRINSVEMVKAFADAEVHLGIDTVRQFDMGYGPRQALEFCIEKEVSAFHGSVDQVVESMSIWTALSVLYSLQQKEKNRGVQDQGRQVSPDVLEKWSKKAMTLLQGLLWEPPNARYAPYILAKGIWDFGFHNEAKLAAEIFLRRGSSGIDVFFSSFSDAVASEHFPFDIDVRLLPPLKDLIVLGDISPNFRSTHTRFLSALENTVVKNSDVGGAGPK